MPTSSTTGPWSQRVVLVTGGSGRLGRAIAGAFARAGAEVVITARGSEALERTADELRGGDCRVTAITADITRDDDVARLVGDVSERFGRLDVLVNNVGRSTRGKAIETSADDFRDLLEINLLATVRATQASIALLRAGGGHIVNIGSLAGKTASRFLGAYPASKHAVTAYTQQLRLELADEGVHVMLVCPGPIARADSGTRYDDQTQSLPPEATKPGGGVKTGLIDPDRLAEKIVRGCDRRSAELVVPGKARLLFAISQLSASWGDWLVRRFT